MVVVGAVYLFEVDNTLEEDLPLLKRLKPPNWLMEP
jgi:hypothetical protein